MSGPGTGAGSVLPLPRLRRGGGLDLVQRHAALDQILDRVADDHDHVAVLDRIRLVVDAAVSGYDAGSAALENKGHRPHRELDNTIQRVDLALHAAASLDIDDGKARGVQH